MLERLTWHAQQKYIRLVWQGVPAAAGGRAPGGIEPADLAAQAIVDVIEGRRRWNREAAPDFLDFLTGVVDSKLSHLSRSRENRPVRVVAPTDELPGREPAPEHTAAEGENLARLQDLVFAAVGQDPIALLVMEHLEAGVTRPAAIADRIGVDVREIYNAQKRLRQKIGSALRAGQGDEP
ncbi:hypothetical protein J0H58_33170 [bacterium]|nr:hypothetical protein [bacterium]